jgi:hypothetical protein
MGERFGGFFKLEKIMGNLLIFGFGDFIGKLCVVCGWYMIIQG